MERQKRDKAKKSDGKDTRPVEAKRETKIFVQTKAKQERLQLSKTRNEGFIVGYSLFLMTDEDIKRRAQCKNIATVEECMDLRMGPSQKDGECNSCGKRLQSCIGHWGYIELKEPIPNPVYMKEILFILKLFDFNTWCGGLDKETGKCNVKSKTKPLTYEDGTKFTGEWPEPHFNTLKPDYPNITGIAKLRLLAETSNDKSSLRKGGITYVNDPPDTPIIREKVNGKLGIVISPKDIKEFFITLQQNTDRRTEKIWDKLLRDGKITEADMEKRPSWVHKIGLGDTKIEGLIMSYIPVLPNTVRLNAQIENLPLRDDLTLFYTEIIKKNIELNKDKKEKDTRAILNDIYNTYRNMLLKKDDGEEQNNHNTSAPKRSIVVRMDGKYGRIRGTILGKRSDHSARTVLTGSPDIPMDEIGIPYLFAEKVTVPEVITDDFKRDEMDILISEGNVKTISRGGRSKVIKDKAYAELKIGDIVERKLQTGDPVVFSRQPILHKGSIMCYKARILKPEDGNVFIINLAVTTPHNADFDGDEGNVAVPQNIYARTEILQKMMSTNCIRGDASSAPLIGLVQDSIIGSFRVTQPGVIVDETTYRLGAYAIGKTDTDIENHMNKCKKFGLVPMSGRAYYSMLFPNNFFYSKKIKDAEAIIIKNGLLMSGVLDKVTVGKTSSSIIDALFLSNGYEGKSGPECASDFISKSQILVFQWLKVDGFSIGYNECVLPDDTQAEITRMIEAAVQTAVKLQEISPDDETGAQLIEQKILSVFKKLQGDAIKFLKKNDELTNNRLLQMIESGAKGAIANAAQIMAILGQQEIAGGRIAFDFDNKSRVTPHFTQYSRDPVARGFCKSSYSKGLSPMEYYMHAKATRPSMIETNLSPADTGYFFRRLWIMLEDMFSYGDQTVRDENGRIVQFLYGGDGFDPQFMSNADDKSQFINVQQIINNILSEEVL